MEKQSLPIRWQKLNVISVLLASILIPITVTVIGSKYTATIKKSEIASDYVKIAIDILQTPVDPNSPGIREWAIDVIDYYSEVPLSSEVRQQLKMERISFQTIGKKISEDGPLFEVMELPRKEVNKK